MLQKNSKVKILSALFLLFISSCFGQKSSTLITTYHYDNGKVEVTFETDSITNHYNGFYKKFDEDGTLRVEGNYMRVDSVKCKDCYKDFSPWDKKYVPYDYAKIESVKVGIWNYYYPDGKIETYGEYAPMVHAHGGSPELIANEGPINVWIRYDDLKQGEWDYFDEYGKKIKTETYYEGALIYTLRYE